MIKIRQISRNKERKKEEKIEKGKVIGDILGIN